MTQNAKAVEQAEPILDRDPILEVGPLAATLLAQVQRPVVIWRPDQGDVSAIAGEVVCTNTALSSFGPYPIIDLDDGTRIWRISVLGSVFQREVGFRQIGDGRWATNVTPGDQLAVCDDGERRAGKVQGRDPYRVVRVIHRPAGGVATRTEAPSLAPIEDEDIPF